MTPVLRPTRDAYGQALLELADSHPKVVVLDADLARSTRTNWFQDRYPERFINAGIAESNLIGMAAGLSIAGWIPFATTYAIFLGRAYDQVRQAIAYAGANVRIVCTHAGLAAAEDGGSHQGVEDLALMSVLPGMTILSPADYHQCYRAVLAAAEHHGPLYLRLGKHPVASFTDPGEPFVIGPAQTLRSGSDVCILATGALVYEALQAADRLAETGVQATVLNITTIKPLDEEAVIRAATRCGRVVTAEEHSRIGGLHAAVCALLARRCPLPVEAVAMDDCFGQTGEWRELMDVYGLNRERIVQAVRKLLGRSDPPWQAS